jgi:DNA polymerase eta
MKNHLGSDTGLWVYNTIRGIDTTEVNSRTQIKSMLSAKSFRPTINTPEQADKWLRIFAADIFSRLVEEGVLENKRRPRTINLHHRVGGQMHSRQGPIPQGKTLDEHTLYELSKDLLRQIIVAGSVWPCANLSLSVGGFEDGVKGNMGINAFLVKGEEAASLRSATPEAPPISADPDRSIKRRRTDDGGIGRFFGRQASTDDGATDSTMPDTPGIYRDNSGHQPVDSPPHACDMRQAEACKCSLPGLLQCSICKDEFASAEELQSHQDWHMAKSLQDQEERVSSVFANRPAAARSSTPKVTGSASKRGRGSRLEQGQSRLKFG